MVKLSSNTVSPLISTETSTVLWTWTVSSVTTLLNNSLLWRSSRNSCRTRLGDHQTQEDLSKKVRLVVGLLRNGTNGRIWLCPRVVLPRMSDTAESLSDLLEYRQPSLPTNWMEQVGIEAKDTSNFMDFLCCGFQRRFLHPPHPPRGVALLGGVSVCCFWP